MHPSVVALLNVFAKVSLSPNSGGLPGTKVERLVALPRGAPQGHHSSTQ